MDKNYILNLLALKIAYCENDNILEVFNEVEISNSAENFIYSKVLFFLKEINKPEENTDFIEKIKNTSLYDFIFNKIIKNNDDICAIIGNNKTLKTEFLKKEENKDIYYYSIINYLRSSAFLNFNSDIDEAKNLVNFIFKNNVNINYLTKIKVKDKEKNNFYSFFIGKLSGVQFLEIFSNIDVRQKEKFLKIFAETKRDIQIIIDAAPMILLEIIKRDDKIVELFFGNSKTKNQIYYFTLRFLNKNKTLKIKGVELLECLLKYESDYNYANDFITKNEIDLNGNKVFLNFKLKNDLVINKDIGNKTINKV